MCQICWICVFVVVHCRSAGTVGAVVTCPLEVVKTRLQSSTAFQAPSQRIVEPPGPPGGPANNGGASELLRPEQRRKLSTTILRNRSQPQVIGGVRRVVPNFLYFLLQSIMIINIYKYIYTLSFQAKVQTTTIITNNNNNTSWPSLYINYSVQREIFNSLFFYFTDNGYFTLRHLIDNSEIHEHYSMSAVS